jgi:sugar/nucleoside kinase (ribokinase family)
MDVIAAGLICLDIIPTFPGPAALLPGRVTEVGPVRLATGGAVANTGLALHRLGVSTRLMGKVGQDLFGQATLNIIQEVDPTLLEGMSIVPGEVSSYTIVLSPPGTDRMFFHCPSANHSFNAQDVRFELVEAARLFHLGYPPYMQRLYAHDGRELVEIFRRVKALGVTTSLDLALPDPAGPSGQVDWEKLLENVLPYVDLLLPSAEELCFMLDLPRFREMDQRHLEIEEIQALAQCCFEMEAKVVMVKHGDHGLYLRTAGEDQLNGIGRALPADLSTWVDREVWSPCFEPQPLVGTTGSGDATVAGFLAALLKGLSLEDAVTMACAVGACNVEATDALGGIRSWEETLQRVQAGWARQPVALSLPGWKYRGGLFFGPQDQFNSWTDA